MYLECATQAASKFNDMTQSSIYRLSICSLLADEIKPDLLFEKEPGNELKPSHELPPLAMCASGSGQSRYEAGLSAAVSACAHVMLLLLWAS
jgi:hypothetical protein